MSIRLKDHCIGIYLPFDRIETLQSKVVDHEGRRFRHRQEDLKKWISFSSRDAYSFFLHLMFMLITDLCISILWSSPCGCLVAECSMQCKHVWLCSAVVMMPYRQAIFLSDMHHKLCRSYVRHALIFFARIDT